MPRYRSLHPKAYLKSKRNVQAGLISRSKILQTLDKGPKKTGEIAKETSLSYDCVSYHLIAMRKDRVVDRVSKSRPYRWQVTAYGQQELPI